MNFETLKSETQQIIDLIAEKNISQAEIKLVKVSDDLDDFLDTSEDDENLVEIARYQVLLNHLQQKIQNLKIQLN